MRTGARWVNFAPRPSNIEEEVPTAAPAFIGRPSSQAWRPYSELLVGWRAGGTLFGTCPLYWGTLYGLALAALASSRKGSPPLAEVP